MYHIFSDERDEWLEDYEEALALFNKWAEEVWHC